ncbi:uncharacterized protein YndB with AHSA1/START domain [Murinocardiopsis flavida]|uniref:Uncharacterized protein YndB with AHSA1/START domain n=1 Tax=Murinocardiopsis flavida TaxID=645275 RepID=A0A2P8D3G9_9ACTN|nr:SRPBCC domain-containing protein [Murinocardiopsis flavida]PSK91764.1 uncharacterized protein YndB with AHSA1/START domain [Murinocardiopsis flavida]
MTRPPGLTKDAGFQIGVSRTLPLPSEAVWRFLTGPDGIALWLGRGAVLSRERGTAYRTDDGTNGEVRGFHEGTRIRLTHRPAGGGRETTIQVTMARAPSGTTIGFHQERMSGPAERERQRGHWRRVVADLENSMLPGPA